MSKWLTRIFMVLMIGAVGPLVVIQPALAHGGEEHGQQEKKSAHMQAMYALKKEIPEEYRIMERTPVLADEESIAQGKQLYDQQCLACHGANGRGDGPAAGSLEPPPANFLDLDHSKIYGPGEKFWIIGNGSGETGMPAFAQIDLIDRWHLVNYIYHLQEKTADGKEPGD